jgi:hypothetical protein
MASVISGDVLLEFFTYFLMAEFFDVAWSMAVFLSSSSRGPQSMSDFWTDGDGQLGAATGRRMGQRLWLMQRWTTPRPGVATDDKFGGAGTCRGDRRRGWRCLDLLQRRKTIQTRMQAGSSEHAIEKPVR